MKIRTVASGFTLIALVVCTSYTSAAQQTTERVIRRLPVEQNEPLAITDIKVNGQSVSFDKKFVADDDWMRSLVVAVKNKSDKRILFASIRLDFPRPAGSQDKMSIYDIFNGNSGLQMRPPTPEERLVGIPPGESVEIRLSVQQFVELRNFLTATRFPRSIERVDMSISHVIFGDDSMWYAGAICRRDPKEPSSWINSRVTNSKPQ